jgi:hypothetical protein
MSLEAGSRAESEAGKQKEEGGRRGEQAHEARKNERKRPNDRTEAYLEAHGVATCCVKIRHVAVD